MPTPRTSIRPTRASAGRTSNRPLAGSRCTRSSPISLAKRKVPARAASMSASARRDFPAPDGPRIKTARAPTSTAEAGAKHRRHTVGVQRAGAVFHPDGAAMGFGDLFGDGEAEAGILAESLVRAIGIKTLEDFIEHVRPYARAVVID